MTNSKWEKLNGQFMDFINAAMENISEDNLIEQCGIILSAFSRIIIYTNSKNEKTTIHKLWLAKY